MTLSTQLVNVKVPSPKKKSLKEKECQILPEHVAEVPPCVAVPGHVCEVAAVVASHTPNPVNTICYQRKIDITWENGNSGCANGS